MIITVISEPRSGSSNLCKWFKKSLNDYIVLFEPTNIISVDYLPNVDSIIKWINLNKNYIINIKFNEIYNIDVIELLKISDKIICLYREDSKSQIESYVVADVTNQWLGNYNGYGNHIIKNIDSTYSGIKIYFEKYKDDFKKFIESNGFKAFSYEDLYYRGKINELKEYLNLNIDTPFPFGEKYRKNIIPDKLI